MLDETGLEWFHKGFEPWATYCCCCLVVKSRLTLCDPMDCSPPVSSVHGILQARILEWVAIPFPRNLPDPGIEPTSPALQADSSPLNHREALSNILKGHKGMICRRGKQRFLPVGERKAYLMIHSLKRKNCLKAEKITSAHYLCAILPCGLLEWSFIAVLII